MSDPSAHGHGGDHGHGDPHGHATPPTPPAPPPKPGAVVIGFLVLLIGEVVILANSGITIPSVLPEPISTYAGDVDRLFYVILALVGFFFFLTEGLLVYFIVKYRAREGGRARHTHGNHALELTWTFIPGLILFALAVFQTGTWGMIKFKGRMPHEGDPNVEVIDVFAKQFEWRFRFHGPNGVDFVKTAEMHVPVGRKVIVRLQTRDVIHSFSAPERAAEAGSPAGPHDQPVVRDHDAGPVADRLRRALRQRPHHDAGDARGRERGRLPRLARGTGEVEPARRPARG